MARLKLHLVERTDFTKFFDPSSGLFVPGTDPPAVGSDITVEIVFQKGPRVLLRGTCAWRRSTGDARARPGAGITVDSSESAKLAYVFGYVRGGLIDARRRRRLPVRLRVAYSSARGRRVNFTRDLHEEGAFVRTAELFVVGACTQLLISPPGKDYRPIDVHGTVTRTEANGDRGVGVRFDFDSDRQRKLLEAFVLKLENDYLDGRLPDDVLL